MVAVWSIVCPWFWELGYPGYVTTAAVGGFIVARVLGLREKPQDDERTFAAWCAWLGLLYLLPMGKRYGWLGELQMGCEFGETIS